MRSCQYRATIAIRACMPVSLPGNEREINEPQLMDETGLYTQLHNVPMQSIEQTDADIYR